MSQIGVTRLYGVDAARLSADDIDTLRHSFAAAVVNVASTCRDNGELLPGLAAAMPPAPASHFLES
jgi:hypothetical protein